MGNVVYFANGEDMLQQTTCLEDLISQKYRPRGCLLVCNDYKFPCPLRLDCIDLMPDKSPLNNPNYWSCLVCAGRFIHNNICGNLLGIEKDRIGKEKVLLFSQITKMTSKEDRRE